MSLHATTVKHATLIYEDERNAARTVRGIGFRGVCSCGERSRVFASTRMARAWNREHARIPHTDDPLTIAGPLGDRPATIQPGQ